MFQTQKNGLRNDNMVKRVVVISSSPRAGGNSDTLCYEFVKGAIEAGNDAKFFTRLFFSA